MRRKSHVVALCLLVSAGLARAQVKASGNIKCGKPDVEHKVDVGPNHFLVLDQSKCSADKDKPFEVNEVKSANAVSSNFSDVHGNKSKFHGYYSDTMDNGDKGEYSFQGSATMKDNTIQTAEDSWWSWCRAIQPRLNPPAAHATKPDLASTISAPTQCILRLLAAATRYICTSQIA